MEDDLKKEKSGKRVGSSVSRMRKPVPPPVVELLSECLRRYCEGVVGGLQFRSSAEVVVGFIQVSVRQKRSAGP